MLKILQAKLQKVHMNHELPDVQAIFRKGRGTRHRVQARFRKGRGTRHQIANIRWIIQKAKRFPEKYVLLLY